MGGASKYIHFASMGNKIALLGRGASNAEVREENRADIARFNGVWVRKAGQDSMAEIKDGKMTWAPRFGNGFPVLFKVLKSGELSMVCNSKTVTAFLDNDDLRWDDGDTWTRDQSKAFVLWKDHSTLVKDLYTNDGQDVATRKAVGNNLLNHLGLRINDVGSQGRDEAGNLLANQCFYLAMAASYSPPETPKDHIEDTALVFKRMVEASVISQHPEWKDNQLVGDHVQAFSDFLPSAMRDRDNLMAAMAAMIVDSASGQVELYRGPRYVDLDPIVQQKNMLLLWYTPGHYQCLVSDTPCGTSPGFTYDKLEHLLKDGDIAYCETIDFD